MNIYKMNYKETMKENEKIKKTNFGKRDFLLSMFPVITAIFLFIFMCLDRCFNDDLNLIVLSGMLVLNLSIFGLSLMLYFNMLKDFICSKNDK